MRTVFLVLFLCVSSLFFSADWTLGVMEFSFAQPSAVRQESSARAASVLPQLILEQFSMGSIRSLPESEVLDRKLKELQTERISLFLQLSKECQERDALILKSLKPRAFEKAVKEKEAAIRKIEADIDRNLENEQIEREKSLPRIEMEERGEKSEKRDGRHFFRFPFFSRNDEDEVVQENVVLYKNDTTALFKPSEAALADGFSSWNFEKEVVNAKINGLLTGSIVCYGDYCSVTVQLRVYPGSRILGSVTEVGRLGDLLPLARSIAQNLGSKIANSMPVIIEFQIEPPEAASSARISIDGVVFSLERSNQGGYIENKVLKESGIHTIAIDASGYEGLSVTYSFTGEPHFVVRATLVPVVSGVVDIRLKKYQDGVFTVHALNDFGIDEETRRAQITVNNKTVLGVFSVPKKDEDDSDASTRAFYRIPANSAFDGAHLVVNAKPFDRAENIDKRRRRMYTAYTALICSLPFTFYTTGRYTVENNAYSQGRGSYSDVQSWQRNSSITIGITAVCGVWFAFEIVRYLCAADKVLPADAKIDKKMKSMGIEQVESAPKESPETQSKVRSAGDPAENDGADAEIYIEASNEIIVTDGES